MRILIIDDDEISLELLRSSLETQRHEVVSATDGEEAYSLLTTEDCHLVISDWLMPGMSGIELCQKIRQSDLPGYVYVILLTGRKEKHDVIEGLSAGADDFITKPFDPSELTVRVRTGERILSLETRDVAIFAMAKLAESRDPETGMHLDRIRSYTRILGQTLMRQEKFPDVVTADYVRMLFLTSPLHDIGKVAIPDCVLLKPGRLSDEEFGIMKSHATAGAETLGAAAEQYPGVAYLGMARDIAASHHERFDGTGYPAGLAGTDIPLCGRIVALADVYDALTSKRVYKEAFTHTVARNIIVKDRGTHFDPDVVDAFLECESEFANVRSKLAESELVAI